LDLGDGNTFTVKNAFGELDGYYGDNIGSCIGDFDIDHDIDGVDVAKYASLGTGTRLDELASNFGILDCLSQ
jgi:hypothetical protein